MLLLLLACADEPKGDPDPRDTDTADTDPGDTDPGDTDPGDTDSGDTDSGGDTEPHPVAERHGTFTAWDARVPVPIYERYNLRRGLGIGDLDGDGRDELAVVTGESGEALSVVSYDPGTGVLDERHVLGDTAPEEAWIVAGRLFVYLEGIVYVFPGPVADGTRLEDAPTTIAASEAYDVASAGDLDGDGVEDVTVTVSSSGAAVFTSLPAGALSLSSAYLWIDGIRAPHAGDFDGDGVGDLLVDDRVVFGPLPAGNWAIDDLAPVTITLPYGRDVEAAHATGDLDGDGRDGIAAENANSIFLLDGLGRDGVAEADAAVDCYSAVSGYLVTFAGTTDGDGDGDHGLVVQLDFHPRPSLVAVWNDRPTGTAPCQLPDMLWTAHEDEDIEWTGVARLGGGGDVVALTDYGEGGLYVGLGAGEDGADADRDTFADDDCDDSDAAVHPAAAETADGRDEDCDGGVDEGAGRTDALAASATFVGTDDDALGDQLEVIDDDGDGVASLVVVGTGHGEPLYVVPPGGTLADVTATRRGASDRDVAALGDYTGDGLGDLAIALDGARILPGPLAGDFDEADDPEAFTLSVAGGYSGFVAAIGDVDGDGIDDVYFGQGSSGECIDDADRAAAYIFTGGGPGDLTETDAFAIVDGGLCGPTWMDALPAVDLDGDGFDDVVVSTGSNVVVLPGAADSLGDATTILQVPGVYDATSGDLDEDGAPEIYLASYTREALLGYEAPLPTGTADASAAVVTMRDAQSSWSGLSVAFGAGSAGPLLLLGHAYHDGGGLQAGAVWAFAAPFEGELDPDAAVAVWHGARALDWAGSSLAVVDHDGVPSAAVGIPGLDGGLVHDGGVDLVRLP